MSDAPRMFAGACRRRGAAIVLRSVSTLPGPVPGVNPPTVVNPVASGALAAGATAIALRCDTAQGRLAAGDTISFGGGALYTVSADTLANAAIGPGSGFSAVPVTPALANPVADGTAATLAFAADITAYAMIEAYPLRLVDGQRILQQDLQIRLPCWKMPALQPTWRVLFGGKTLSIVSSTPTFKRSEQVYWTLQAR